MIGRRIAVTFVLAAVVAGLTPVRAARAADCLQICAEEIDACAASGWTRSTCTVFAVALCQQLGPGICEPAPAADAAGRVRFLRFANTAFDRYTAAPSSAQQQWMRDHYWRLVAYAPYFDSRLRWYPDAWFYKDLYAVYPGQSVVTQHPEWVLRDARGAALYIPYGCSGGTCPQYAGDLGNPAFRAAWIAQAAAVMANGYRGIWVDDVNMAMMVGDGTGRLVAPVDPRRGAPMTIADWRGYVATFTEEIRAALGGAEIVHNQVWFFAPPSDPAVTRAIAAADVINVERGFNDSGIRGGGGQYGFDTLLGYLDTLHARGKGALLQSGSTSGRDYGLATYFLVATARDGFSHGSESLPDAWWPGWDVSLGAPAGGRYAWRGLVRRDFARGLVLVNPPDRPSVTVDLGAAWRGLDGQVRSTVTLGAAQGIVLVP